MIEEKKQALIKVLYSDLLNTDNHLLVRWDSEDYNIIAIGCGRVSLVKPFMSGTNGSPQIEEVKPYLRPLSYMTEKEEEELGKKYNFNINSDSISIKYHSDGCWDDDCQPGFEDYRWLETWLIIHKFDYLGLIKDGLALVAKKGMYKFN